MSNNNSYPMISETVWWKLRNQFKKSIPSTISLQYLQSLLQLKNKDSAKTIMGPLKVIGFIDEAGKPTDRLYDWKVDSKYADVCDAILKDLYPEELLSLCQGGSVNKSVVENYFTSVVRVGQAAVKKYTGFFMLLISKTINDDSDKIKTKSTNKETTKKTTSKQNTTSVEPSKKFEDSKTEVIHAVTTPKNTTTLHIDLQIHISPEADAEQIDHIFASMAKYLYKD